MSIHTRVGARFIACAFLAMAALCAVSAVSAAPAETRGIYRVPPAARDALMRIGAVVDHSRIEGDLVAELDAGEVEALRRAGFEPRLMFASEGEMDREGGRCCRTCLPRRR